MSSKPKATKEIGEDIKVYIQAAVKEGIEAGRKIAKKEEEAKFVAYPATERRLYALPDIKEKVNKAREHLRDLADHGRQGHSKDICRFQFSGQRLSEEEIVDALTKDIQATIAKNIREIEEVEDALAPLTRDPYYRALEAKYFEQIPDDNLAAELNCDASTVRRNRARLVRRVAVRLYGADAL